VFGITEVLQKLRDIIRKLDFMSGSIYYIEATTKKIWEKVKYIAEKVDKILEILTSLEEEDDLSSFEFTKVQIDQIIIEGVIEKMTINEFQRVSATVDATKKNGQPAQVENLTVETDRSDILTAEVNGNEVVFKAVEGSVSEPTAVLCTAKADADLGEGVREISVSDSITVVPGEAEALGFKFSEPEDNV
jgi:hypothetical protein